MTLWEAINLELERLAPKCAYPKDYPWAQGEASKLRQALVDAASTAPKEEEEA